MDSAPVLILPNTNFLPSLAFDQLLPIVFLIVLGMYLIFAGVLYYHWNNYSNSARVTTLTYIIFAATTVPLIILMASAAIL